MIRGKSDNLVVDAISGIFAETKHLCVLFAGFLVLACIATLLMDPPEVIMKI